MKQTTTLDPIWEQKYSSGHAVKYPYDSVVSFVFKNRPKNLENNEIKILELGCGTGNNIWFLAREDFQAYGIDGSRSAVEYANNHLRVDGLSANLEVGDFTRLPYDDNFFDLVIDRASITCCGFSAATKTVQEVRRCLKQGGKFFFNPYSDMHSSYTAGNLSDDGIVVDIKDGTLKGTGQICFYGKRQALALVSDGFDVESISHIEVMDVTEPSIFNHTEWRVVARKL